MAVFGVPLARHLAGGRMRRPDRRQRTGTGLRSGSGLGYSGGGTLAALLVERQRNLRFWGTIAGNLKREAWADYHRATPLAASLHPAARRQDATGMPQVHGTGTADAVVPPRFSRAWCTGESSAPCGVVDAPGMVHGGAWEKMWPDLLARFRPARALRGC